MGSSLAPSVASVLTSDPSSPASSSSVQAAANMVSASSTASNRAQVFDIFCYPPGRPARPESHGHYLRPRDTPAEPENNILTCANAVVIKRSLCESSSVKHLE